MKKQNLNLEKCSLIEIKTIEYKEINGGSWFKNPLLAFGFVVVAIFVWPISSALI